MTHFSECAVNLHRKVFNIVLSSLSVNTVSVPPVHVVKVTTTPTYQYTNQASEHAIVREPVFSISHVNTCHAPVVVTLYFASPLHIYDVPVPTNLLCHVRKVSAPTPHSTNLTTTSTYHTLIKKFSHFHQQLMIAPRKSIFYEYNYECKGISFPASFSRLITLLFHVILNFQLTQMILAYDIFSIFNLITLTYMQCYTNVSRILTNCINQKKYFAIWFFNFFYLCQVIKVVWVIIRKNFTSATKFLFLIGPISVKSLQSTKFKVKCYRCFINLEFSDSNRKKCGNYPSVRISKRKQLNVFNILILFKTAPLLLYFLTTF